MNVNFPSNVTAGTNVGYQGGLREFIGTDVMGVFRKSLAWLLLATYFFANTLTAGLHDHHACCGHGATGHQYRGGEHHHADEGCTDRDDDHEGDADELHGPHDCAVCEFLAQAPLATPTAGLIPSGDLPPVEAPRAVLLILTALAGRHLPRGPPAVS